MDRNDIILRLIELQYQVGQLLRGGKLYTAEYKVISLEIRTLQNQLTQWDKEEDQEKI